MNPETERQIAEQLSALLFSSRATELRVRPRIRPVDVYAGEGRHRRERDELFGKYPIVLGYAAELEKPGDFVTRDICGVPILLTRDHDGKPFAFRNVCRHRANIVCASLRGNQSKFRCQYHGWIYGNDGRCLSFSNPEAFHGLSHEDFALSPLQVEIKHGIIWVLPSLNTELSVKTFLGATLDDELASCNYLAAQVFDIRRDSLPFNWKLGVETFLEIFHIATLHESSIAKYFLDGLMTSEKLGLHHRIVAAHRSFAKAAMKPKSEWALADHVVVIYLIFPNTVYLRQSDHIQLYTFYAGDRPGTCVVQTALLTPRGRLANRATKLWETNWHIISNAVYEEDFKVSEHVQRAIEAGAAESIVFGRNEGVLQDYHDDLDRCLGNSDASQHCSKATNPG